MTSNLFTPAHAPGAGEERADPVAAAGVTIVEAPAALVFNKLAESEPVNTIRSHFLACIGFWEKLSRLLIIAHEY